MKKLVVYYSFEGNTEYFAKVLAKELGADIISLKPTKELKSKGFSKFVWGGMAAVMKKKPELEHYNFNPSDYDVIIFATPVWAGTYAPPILTFLTNEDLVAKKVAYFYCHEGGIGKTKERFDEALSENHILGNLDLHTKQVDKSVNEKKLLEWAHSIMD